MSIVGYDSDLTETPWDGVEEWSDTPDTGPELNGTYDTQLGRMLELAQSNPAEVCSQVVRDWERQDPAMRRRKVFWDRNTLWLRGVRGVRAYPARQDMNEWRLYVPMGAMDTQPVLDRCDELCERVTAQLLADPPMPEPEPAHDTPMDRDAADFARRLLLQEAGTAGVNYQAKFRRAHKKAAVFGSGFTYTWVDPVGGGLHPALAREGVYLTPDGTETTNPADAAQVWWPKLRVDVLTGLNVRFLPDQCNGMEDADGAMVMFVRTLGQFKAQFESVRDASVDALMTMVNWRPEAMQWVLPWYQRLGYSTGPVYTADGAPGDESLVCAIARWEKVSPTNPKGCYVIVLGGAQGQLAHASTWSHEVTEQDGTTRTEPLDIPLAQIRQFDDTDGDDPYGYGMSQKIGPADEVRGTIVLGWLEHLDRFLRPNTFVPIGSTIQPEDLASRSGIPMFYNPNGGGVPTQEEIPPFDPNAKEFFDRATLYENDATSLQEAAQGVASASVTSGRQAAIIIQQAQQNLATLRQNLADGIERTWRIMLQQVRAFYDQPQRLKYVSDDGRYMERAWSGADLGATTDVKIAIGSFTMYHPQGKLDLAVQYSQLGLIDDPAEFKRIASGAIHPSLGVSDSPTIQRIRRQCAMWREGPPEGWVEQAMAHQQAMQAAMQQAQAQGMTPDQFDPAQFGVPPMPPSPFVRVPSDEEPKAAAQRHNELFRLTQSTEMERWPEPWGAALIAEYQAMRQAAGVLTMAEQNEAGQAAAQAASEAEAAQEAEKEKAMTDRELTTQAQQGVIDAQLQAQKVSLQQMVDAEKASAEQALQAANVRPMLSTF